MSSIPTGFGISGDRQVDPPNALECLQRRVKKLESVLDIARVMTSEHELDRLLQIIVEAATEVVEADRCSLWIVDRDSGQVWTKVAEGLGDAEELRMPLGSGIAGQVAATGDIINIVNAYEDDRFNPEIDRFTGYTTETILAVPMRHQKGGITGVLQALNRKNGKPFDVDDAELLVALGANAAAAIENAMLHEDIDKLFEGFVKAAVTAIESRDPTTSGHSERVAILTLGIAETTSKVEVGTYADVDFTPEEMRELRYASLLHDFGKVGVRENVLVKANKLYPWELDSIEDRFHGLRLQRENAFLKETIARMAEGKKLDSMYRDKLRREFAEADEFLEFVRRCNLPAVLAEDGFDRLKEIAAVTFADRLGQTAPILTINEIQRLSIPRGSLDANERQEIESHVTHTYRFLKQIPWTKNLKRVPAIAYGHHEKLNGRGYPQQLVEEEIPVQTRMMTIADIYDALTARDRPYKKAVPLDKALDILHVEAKQGYLDSDLLKVFVDAKIYERANYY